ncbi:MAG: hypothetical protein ABIN79_07155 [Marmoricola sp.]
MKDPATKKRSRRLVAIVAAVLVLVLAGAGFAAFALTRTDTHSISTPATAGGMKREADKETALKAQLDAAETQFKSQGKDVSYVKSAIYNQTDAKRGPAGSLVFLGGKEKTAQKPDAFIKEFVKFIDEIGKQAGADKFKIANVSAGDAGGKAVCASQTQQGQKIAICAWATEDSMGEVIPTVPGWDAKTLTKVMLDLRADVEKSE